MGACGSGSPSGSASTTSTSAPSTTSTTSTTSPARQTSFSLYFVRGEVLGVSHRSVPATKAVARAALDALLAGPDALERSAGLGTAVPAGTSLLGLGIAGGVATVDLDRTFESGGGSLSMTERLAEVVYTVTQFPTVTAVRLELGGVPVTALGGEGILVDHPVGRLDAAVINVVPPILLESPAVGDRVNSPLHVTGMSNTFEATYNVQLVDASGRTVVDSFGTATAGTGTWGTFDDTFPYSTTASGLGELRVFEVSAKDGSHINEVDLSLPVGH